MKPVQHGLAEIAAGNIQILVDIDPVPVGKSFAKITWRATDGYAQQRPTAELTTVVNGKYTQLKLTRYRDVGTLYVRWQVVTDHKFTIQHGIVQLQSVGSLSVAITEVDTTKTWVITTVGSADELAAITGARTALNTTSLDIVRSTTTATPTVVSYFVISHEDATVISGVEGLTWTTVRTITVPQYAPDVSFVEYNYHPGSSTSPSQGAITCEMETTTSITFKRENVTSGAVYLAWFLVTFTGVTTQQIDISLSSGGLSGTAALSPSVDLSTTWITGRARRGSSSSRTHNLLEPTLTLEASQVVAQREASGEIINITAMVITFEPTVLATPIYPVDESIIPYEQVVFRGSTPEGLTITAFEIQYREVGEVDWISTGQVDGNDIIYTMPSETFEAGKNYEWQVRVWQTGQSEPTGWSPGETFNTIYPVIQNLIPSPDSSIRVDIQNFGGRLKSPYGRDIQLTIEIADNVSFANATTYTLPAVPSGAEAIMQHAIQQGGTWYVRMTATDSDALQTVLEYSYFAGLFIQFITHPDIDIEAQSATHVTVRVKDTATEYTAVIDPAPTADKVIERLFYISTGTQANCQAVAEAFLAKLGRRQLTVSGVIPLTVTLKIGQYVRVVIPTAKINQDMILQRKQHRINEGEAVTHVTLGDIKVSDQEMIARIVERLESQGV